jgi:hypothetical protein
MGLTFWTAIISNGWWVLYTQQLNEVLFIPIFLITLLSSIAYLVVFGVMFIDDLD